jgi:sterol desaturase/sphingolipid hydroxylase (fatty acid hydroxylase superfamily)
MDQLDGSDLPWRIGAFAAVLGALALAELLWPRRELRHARLARWATNLSIVALGAVLVRVMGLIAQPLVAAGAALLAEGRGWGLLNLVAWPTWLEIAVALVVLDFAVYLQHVLSHRVPALWRIHRMHHADVDFDVTTALRFHPLEIGLSMLYKVVWALALGPAVLAVVLFELILNACAMFNHSNLYLPAPYDRMLRTLLVTPDMHRVHHSVLPGEHHRNFGFNLSIWDWLFATYKAEPRDGHEAMTIGLAPWQSQAPTQLGWCLSIPFVRGKGPPASHFRPSGE